MPDWSYEPLLRPLLFRVPPVRARALTVGTIGWLGRSSVGRRTIDFLGHMRAPSALAVEALGCTFSSPIGLGAGLDPGAQAVAGFARFGFGFVEVGPITPQPVAAGHTTRDDSHSSIDYEQPLANAGADVIHGRLTKHVGAVGASRLRVRLAAQPGATEAESAEQLCELVTRFAPLADYAVIDLPEAAAAGPLLARVRRVADTRDPPLPLLLVVTPEPDAVATAAGHVHGAGAAGLVIAGGLRTADGASQVGAPTRAASLAALREARNLLGPEPTIVASGGIMSPGDALATLAAGADLVQVHTGLIFGGPGLAKRANEALLWAQRTGAPAAPSGTAAPRPLWLGFWALAVSMIVSGCAAAVVALNQVVLWYDLEFVSMSRAALDQVNPHLLDFMRHDRVTLAGVMVSIGVLYYGLTWFGVRHGVHWARQSLVLSAVIGFASFFLFLAFGYFDPLHAWLSALLFVFFLGGLAWPAHGPARVPLPDLAQDRAWRRGVAGQLLFVILGVEIIGGGLTIARIGGTHIFVPEDLEFMNTTADALRAANPRLPALIAHDRAGFGGALVANGVAVLTVALWGFRRGAAWLWWMLLLAGLPALGAALGIHLTVGYVDLWHLAPVLLAAALYAAGLALSRGFLCARAPAVEPS